MKRFNNILYVKSIDPNEAALASAVTLAKENQAKLTLVDTAMSIPNISFYGFPDKTVKLAEVKIQQKQLDDLEQRAQKYHDDLSIKTDIVEGKRFIAVIQDVLRNNRDLVIKAAEGNPKMLGLFGSTDMRLLRKCPCPVWLIKPEQDTPLKTIVAAVDLDLMGDESENALLNKKIMETALSLAHREQAVLYLIHAWEEIPDDIMVSPDNLFLGANYTLYSATDLQASREKQMAHLLEQAKTWVEPEVFHGVDLHTKVVQGYPPEVIEDMTKAHDADLLVMGSVGRSGIPGFFIGNTAEFVFSAIDCSVLAIKPEGFVSPVTVE